MTSQESCCKIVDFQEYLGKKELELQMKQIVNREIMVIVPHPVIADCIRREEAAAG